MQNSQFENLIVLDIETIPDTSCAYQLCNLDNKIEYSEQELRQKIEEYHLNITDGKNTFPRQLFHKVVCISFLEAKIEQLDNGKNFLHFGKLQTYSCMQKSTEEEMIQKFWDYLKSKKPQIVTFNGRTFDIPVLKYRAMKYKIDCGWFFDFGGKWDGYGSKYAKAHMDMIDFLSDFNKKDSISVKA